MEEEIEAKQQYLRKEIIDKGYDPDVFSKYIVDQKGEDGFDLENWAMNELAALVSNFKRQINEEKEINIINEAIKERKIFQYEMDPYQERKDYCNQDTNIHQHNNNKTIETIETIETKGKQIDPQTRTELEQHKKTNFFDDETQLIEPQHEKIIQEDSQQINKLQTHNTGQETFENSFEQISSISIE